MKPFLFIQSRLLSLFSLLFLITCITASPIPSSDADLITRDESPSFSQHDLLPRGCSFSKQAPPIQVCSTVPTVAQLVTTLTTLKVVSNKDSIFYSGLGGGSAQTTAKNWYKKNVKGGRGAVSFSDISAGDWYLDQIQALGGPNAAGVDSFQKRLSQAFAEVSSGRVYFFTTHGTDGTTMSTSSAWGGWEYPALTRNSQVTDIFQVDPSMTPTDAGAVIWTKSHGPSSQAPLG
jgi:hypothetical protein